MHRLMAFDDPPTAIVAATDVLAIGIVHAALQRGLRAPHDLSASGVDDIPGVHGAAERHETQSFEMVGNRGIYHRGWTAPRRRRWAADRPLHR